MNGANLFQLQSRFWRNLRNQIPFCGKHSSSPASRKPLSLSRLGCKGHSSGGCLTSICLPSSVLCARTTVKQSQSLTGSCLNNVKYFYIHQNTPKQLKKLFISRFPHEHPKAASFGIPAPGLSLAITAFGEAGRAASGRRLSFPGRIFHTLSRGGSH